MASQVNTGQPWQPLWKPEKTERKKPQRISPVGKVAQKWATVKAQYLKEHPADYRGYRMCGICSGQVGADEVDVDHIINRSLRPDLRYEYSNLQICHAHCNLNKKNGL